MELFQNLDKENFLSKDTIDDQDYNQMREFATGATRNVDTDKLEYKGFISPSAMKKFSQYMHKNRFQADGKIREADNWQKGIPLSSYESSLIRHVFEFWEHLYSKEPDALEKADETACAILFNIQGWIHEREKSKK